MEHDEDILSEEQDLQTVGSADPEVVLSTKSLNGKAQRSLLALSPANGFVGVPLNWKPGQGGHRPNADTLALFREAGGREAMVKFTSRFYQRAFADPHIDKFIRDHNDPHGQRFADWITEKFGGGNGWTVERSTRRTCPFKSHGHMFQSAHDRSSAHFTAWHSPKREPHKFGEHFKLDDCRVWMRLHFWALRESGVWDASPGFAEYYMKFIGHFVSIYERTAVEFVRESARWSADLANCQAYIDNGNVMVDEIIGMPHEEALSLLPREEREALDGWPYL